MNIFWILSLIISTFAVIFLIIFSIPFNNKKLYLIISFLYKFWIPILSCSGFYCFIIAQELVSIKYYNKKTKINTDSLHFETANLFKAQRNFYLVLFGLILLVGILLIIWQVHSWYNRNEAIRNEIFKKSSKR